MGRPHAHSRQGEQSEAKPPRLLTHRELEVIELVALGCSNAQIAQQLGISAGTVKWHLVRIYSKLNVHNRMQAVLRTQVLKPSS